MRPRQVEGSLSTRTPAETPPTTSQKILAAALRLLMERGYEFVTLDKVAAEAGVNRGSIRYNYGNKAGLVAAVVDFMLHEEFRRDLAALPSTPHVDLVDRLVAGKRHMLDATDNFRGFFDILPHALRDENLRRRIADMYPWWAEQNLSLLRLEGSGPDSRPPVLQGLGRLVSAVADGLSVQASLDPEGFDMDASLEALEFLIDRAMPDLEKLVSEADEF